MIYDEEYDRDMKLVWRRKRDAWLLRTALGLFALSAVLFVWVWL